LIALVLALVAGLARGFQGDAWAQVWTELEALRAGKTSAAEASVFRAHLGEALRAAPEGPRSALLQAALESLEGRNVVTIAQRLAALRPDPFSPREQWFLADLLPPGAERTRVVLAALASPTVLTRWQVLLAWNASVDEARALRLADAALPIQANLYERYGDAASAVDLAQTYRALGQGQAADQVLAQALERELAAGRRPGELWEARGVNALAFGDESLARDYLGRALALGSEGAALRLARLELQAGRIEAARRGFRTLILDAPPPDRAWRGWGTSLLPAPFAPSRTRIPVPPNA
jgi:tetratricopeptide (TPR) repeat protein